MFALVEAIWYGLLIVLKIAFWPVIVILGLTLILRLIGKIKNSKK